MLLEANRIEQAAPQAWDQRVPPGAGRDWPAWVNAEGDICRLQILMQRWTAQADAGRQAPDAPAPVWILRRWLAAALQCGQLDLAEGVACMHVLDERESRTGAAMSTRWAQKPARVDCLSRAALYS